MEEEPMVIIVGAGPAGLSMAACLSRHSIPYIILEREDCFASLWKKYTYDRLHLHLEKQFCVLPHLPFPDSYPRYVSKPQFLTYLDDYVSRFKINPLYRRSVELAKFDEASNKWTVTARNLDSGVVEEFSARFLAVASGETSNPYTPEIEGLKNFPGDVLHSTQYRNGKAFKDKNVLVVGAGNSGMEIALDLANHGAKTSIVVRSPVLPAISNITGNEVVFDNGKTHTFDTIIFCTGFKRSTNVWLKGDDYLFNEDGLSKVSFPNNWKGRMDCTALGWHEEDCMGQESTPKT
ncbi:Pyridine nucleotide-disulfide oxidoreductase, class-II [Corchorus olitorius]|uniref:indole-3-pyruvate monooxygenase n=1 Tax=Corchorus olitorius TaxID=93759 RepID=A0A1R3KHM6_9ROSI|nr:Pyridine nucleotide-disulfide oxidoreductase, class-II [Corchorus olitorius]